jgi:hypothetical protein
MASKAKAHAKPAAPKTAAAKPAVAGRASAERPQPAEGDVAKTMRAIHVAFARDVPVDMVRSGRFDLEGQRKAAETALQKFGPSPEDVPDGRYRVDGADYIYTVKGGELVMVEKARPETDPSDITAVPNN